MLPGWYIPRVYYAQHVSLAIPTVVHTGYPPCYTHRCTHGIPTRAYTTVVHTGYPPGHIHHCYTRGYPPGIYTTVIHRRDTHPGIYHRYTQGDTHPGIYLPIHTGIPTRAYTSLYTLREAREKHIHHYTPREAYTPLYTLQGRLGGRHIHPYIPLREA